MLTLAEVQSRAWGIAEEKGHHENLKAFPIREATLIRLALVHTEISEAMQEVKRHGVHEGNRRLIGAELADVLIRVADLAEELQIDLAVEVDHKLAQNRMRPYKYGTPEEQAPE